MNHDSPVVANGADLPSVAPVVRFPKRVEVHRIASPERCDSRDIPWLVGLHDDEPC